MSEWHETPAANIGLRLGGILALGFAWFAGSRLFQLVNAHPAGEVFVLEMLLASVTFLSASIGLVLLFVGPGLFERVIISDRWARRLPGPIPREFEPMLYSELARSEGARSGHPSI